MFFSRTILLGLLIAACCSTLRAQTTAPGVKEGPDNSFIPGTIGVPIKLANLAGTPTLLLYIGDTTDTLRAGLPVTSTTQTLAFKGLPLKGGSFTIVLRQNRLTIGKSGYLLPDILTLFYKDSDIPRLVEDGRDLAQERIFCARSYLRAQKESIAAQRAKLDEAAILTTIIIP